MTRTSILLLEDDPKTEAILKEALKEYEVITATKLAQAKEILETYAPRLIIIDYDLRELDGLQAYRQLHALVPQAKYIMLSFSNSVPLAVTATKLGVSVFLRKPLVAEMLKKAVEENLVEEKVMLGPVKYPWLRGTSSAIESFFAELKPLLTSGRNLWLVGEVGINKIEVAEFIHAHSFRKNRKFNLVDLSSFRRENMEAQFWAIVKEMTTEPAFGSLLLEEERCGTLFLKNFEVIEESFKQSILSFFQKRKEGMDKEILVIIDACRAEKVPKGYQMLRIPSLRERKEDLPYLLGWYLSFYAQKYLKNLKGFAPDLLDYLLLYDYPGNYLELEKIVEEGVLKASSEILELKDLLLTFEEIKNISFKKIEQERIEELSQAQRLFERFLYGTLLAKASGDLGVVARFLDVPKTVLAERFEDLVD
jgi:DNA-binding NtrC family response regulator